MVDSGKSLIFAIELPAVIEWQAEMIFDSSPLCRLNRPPVFCSLKTVFYTPVSIQHPQSKISHRILRCLSFNFEYCVCLQCAHIESVEEVQVLSPAALMLICNFKGQLIILKNIDTWSDPGQRTQDWIHRIDSIICRNCSQFKFLFPKKSTKIIKFWRLCPNDKPNFNDAVKIVKK